MLNINIGGTKGWANVPKSIQDKWKILDIVRGNDTDLDFQYDLNSGTFFPLADKVVDNYYSSHTLEHVKPEFVSFILEEMHRTLKTGGLIRIVVPDVALAIQKYMECNRKWFETVQRTKTHRRHGYPNTILGYLMMWFYSKPKGGVRSGHNTVFDWETLAFYIRQVGFKSVIQKSFNDCSPIFGGLDFKRHKNDSLYLEAQK